MKKILSLLMAFCFVFAACEPEAKPDPDPVEKPDDPDNPDQPDTPDEPDVPKVEKDRAVWISATANWARLRTKGDIKTFISKIKRYGFNTIYLEVKLMEGGVLYDSEIMPQLLTYSGMSRDFDYLQYFVDQCKAQGVKLGAAMTVFPTYGLGETAKYKDSDFEGRYCQEIISSAGITDIRDNPDNPSGGIFNFLNPADPFVHDFVLEVAEEIVSKYDIDSFTLDYCRYQNYHSDFSDTSREAFEKYIGRIVKNWPEDVYSKDESGNDVIGEYFNLYQEWRASVITGYVRDISEMIGRVKPEVRLEYWAASWWPLWATGQNWASDARNITGSYWWATPDYYKTGFAKYLDVFQNGAYLGRLFPEYDDGSISFQLNNGMNYIHGDCKMHGSISVSSNMAYDPGEAAHWVLQNTDGLMVFELTHIESGRWWTSLKEGIDLAIEDGSAFEK